MEVPKPIVKDNIEKGFEFVRDLNVLVRLEKHHGRLELPCALCDRVRSSHLPENVDETNRAFRFHRTRPKLRNEPREVPVDEEPISIRVDHDVPDADVPVKDTSVFDGMIVR